MAAYEDSYAAIEDERWLDPGTPADLELYVPRLHDVGAATTANASE